MGYLDTRKSVIISSPAGSGKTEKLARRYCALLHEGAEVQRILAITFTEKAAAEMKERVLRILAADFPSLGASLRPETPLMRISTIHAFCLKLLKRFSIELGLDPSLDVADELTARHLWTESVYEELVAERRNPDEFFRMIKERGLRGWDPLFSLLGGIHEKRPEIELAMRAARTDGEEELKLLSLYEKCLGRFSAKKAERHLIDFADLELMAYEALSLGPEWHNILYAFDEHTDHVLVDEFQDTSRLQWMIIDKLTEEWRAGHGAKADSGKTPTVFLVGDEKQSIYLFRGADVGVFRETKEKFDEWFGADGYHYEEIRDNYRSLPGVVNFVNSLFGHVMQGGGLLDSWRTRYSPFEAVRKEPEIPDTAAGANEAVELLLFPPGADTKQTREAEAALVADNIKALQGTREISDGDMKRPYAFSDMAILLRRRTHLSTFEDALRTRDVPFIVLKGIGFYGEPETALLRDFLYFLADPADGHSLAGLLRSPLFGVGYPALLRLARGKKESLLERLRDSGDRRLALAGATLEKYLAASRTVPHSVLIERLLVETGGWSYFSESQRYANVKKFISMVEAFEAGGLSPLEIREKLIRERDVSDVAKANVNAEGMDAVRIMTVHAAKGLEFPTVFLPSLDEGTSARTGPFVLDEDVLRYEPDPGKRNSIPEFKRRKEKEEEESKRLFYVAATRARDFLSMSSARSEKPKGWLKYLDEAFGILGGPASGRELPFNIIGADDVALRVKGSSGLRLAGRDGFMYGPVFTEPLEYRPALMWRDVTGGQEHDGAAHGEEHWQVLGSAIHGLFEEFSRGITEIKSARERAAYLLRDKGIVGDDVERLSALIMEDVLKLEESGFLKDIILPSGGSYTELPFHLELGGSVFKGRIDRVIVRDGTAYVYDYKTFPVREAELPELLNKYSFQMGLYREAASRLFGLPGAKAFVLFTHVPKLVEM